MMSRTDDSSQISGAVNGVEAEQDAVGKAKPDPNGGEQQEAEAALAEQQ